MKLLLRTVTYLDGHGVVSALIGGGALAAHGIARATLDFDLLVVERTVLTPQFWKDFDAATVEVRPGDLDDPLAGVTRVTAGAETVDVIVGKHTWEAKMLARRVHVTLERQPLPIVDSADLVLLKLFAGGPQDLLDVRLLLAADTGNLRNEVEQRVLDLPVEARRLWKSVCADRTDG